MNISPNSRLRLSARVSGTDAKSELDNMLFDDSGFPGHAEFNEDGTPLHFVLLHPAWCDMCLPFQRRTSCMM